MKTSTTRAKLLIVGAVGLGVATIAITVPQTVSAEATLCDSVRDAGLQTHTDQTLLYGITVPEPPGADPSLGRDDGSWFRVSVGEWGDAAAQSLVVNITARSVDDNTPAPLGFEAVDPDTDSPWRACSEGRSESEQSWLLTDAIPPQEGVDTGSYMRVIVSNVTPDNIYTLKLKDAQTGDVLSERHVILNKTPVPEP